LNDEAWRRLSFVVCASGFFRHSKFVLCHFQGLPLAEKFRKLSAATMSASSKTVPRHIAIIMDGNGRWAKSRGLPRIKGHEAGAQAVRECVEGCGELKVEYLTLYAFSAENWQRPRTEIIALMRLLEKFLKEKTPELLEKNVRLQAIGRLTDLPHSAQEQLHRSIEQTAGNTGLTLILALSYGGRLEIIDGIKSLLRAIELGHIDRAMIDVAMFSKHLYTRYYPDPDLLIRTSGEMRLSNFLLWQTSYTEMYVTPKLWPDFKKQDLLAAVEEFGCRQRRYGAVE
jgi:undecaprenyl diphosphate synthase